MIKGLILTGGQSIRMGTDKHRLVYHGIPQYQHLRHLFSKVGLESCLSISIQQTPDFPAEQHLIVDQYEARGPIGGILSAMHELKDASWLVVACDLPLINESHLQEIINHRSPAHQAVTYQVHPDFYETTCTLYESSCRPILEEVLTNGKGSLQKALRQMTVTTLMPPNAKDLMNVNDQESYRKCLEILKVK